MNRRDRNVTIRYKQVLLPNISITKLYHNNKLTKRYNKQQVEHFGTLIIKNETQISYQRKYIEDKFGTDFGKEEIDINEDDTINSDKSENINKDQEG